MLPKKYRLSTSFFRARKRPTISFVVGGVGVRVYKTDLPYSRYAIIVPFKTAKKAVDRNRIRRLVYNLIRKHIAEIPIFDIVFFVSCAENIKNDINAAIQKLLTL